MALYAFDGTWNQERSAGEYGGNTNVVVFRDAYLATDKPFYTKGVGTKLGWFGRVIGGAFGAGGFLRLKDAHNDLCRRWTAGDHDIDIIGFSRGAAIAVAFANRIRSRGIFTSEGKRVVSKPPIRFLGLWDVVAAFGIPINLGPIEFQSINLGYKLTLPDNVLHAFHALALDERREAFRPTRIKGAYEVWFRGVHSDIGGGNGNAGLNAIPLTWMLKKAKAVGLPIDEAKLRSAEGARVATAAIRPAGFDPRKDPWRKSLENDIRHYTVEPRADCCPDLPRLLESVDQETNAVSLSQHA